MRLNATHLENCRRDRGNHVNDSFDAMRKTRSIEKVEALYDLKLKEVTGDRVFDIKVNAQYLKDREIFNVLCDRGRAKRHGELEKRAYLGMQRRRAQTEGRIGLFKNNFLGRPLRMKGFKSREQTVARAVLTHNVWVLAEAAAG
jgi:hypothetical protein